MVRLVIPIESFDIERSVVSPHFGRAPEFAVVDLSREGRVISITSERNLGGHCGGQSGPETLVADLKPAALVVRGMGPRGVAAFQNNGIAVLTGPVSSLGEAVEAYLAGRLGCLTEPCKDARHGLSHS